MRKTRRVYCRYGSLTLIECLLAIAVPEIAMAQAGPSCSITANPQSPVQVGSSSTLNATCFPAPLAINWSSSNASCSSPVASSFGGSITCAFPTVGTATVTATPFYGGSFSGGAATYVMQVNAARPTNCSISAFPASFPVGGGTVTLAGACTGGSPATSFSWNGPGVSGQTTSVVTSTIDTTATYTFTASNQGGTSNPVSIIVPVAIAPPSGCAISASPASLPIGGGAVDLSVRCSAGGPPTDYAWTGPGTSSQSGVAFQARITTTSTYTVIVSNSAGAAAPASLTVPVAVAATAPTGCLITPSPATLPLGGGNVSLTASCAGGGAPTSFSWTGPGVATQTGAVVTTSVTSTSQFTVTATNAGGSSTASVTINVNSLLAPSGCSVVATPATLPAGGGSVQLTASCTTGGAPASFAWTGAGVAGQTTAIVSTNITTTQTFTVSATNASGTSAPVTITVAVAPPTGNLRAVSDTTQVASPSSQLGQPLVARVVDGQGNPVANAAVSWVVVAGGGTLINAITLSNAQGLVSAGYISGPGNQTNIVRVTALGSGQSVDFTIQVANVGQAAGQLVAPALTTAVNAPMTQMANIRQRLDNIRRQQRAIVAGDVRVSVAGQALPMLSALMLAPASNDPRAVRGGSASADSPDTFERLGLFVNGDVDVGRQSTVDAQPGFKVTTKGITAGVDYRFDQNRIVGAAVGYLKADTDLSDNVGNQDVKGYSFSLFGSLAPAENAYIDGIVNVGHNDYDNRRKQTAEGFATSSTKGDQLGLSLSAGYNYYSGSLTVNPYARIEYVDAKVDGFTEEGSASEILTVGGQKVKQTTLALGGQLSYSISTTWGALIPNGRLEYLHVGHNEISGVNAQLVAIPTSGSSVPVVLQGRDYGNIGAGLQALFGPKVSSFVNYESSFGRDSYRTWRVTLGVRMEL